MIIADLEKRLHTLSNKNLQYANLVCDTDKRNCELRAENEELKKNLEELRGAYVRALREKDESRAMYKTFRECPSCKSRLRVELYCNNCHYEG